jgi:gliding motility-associated lipoprotein GldH
MRWPRLTAFFLIASFAACDSNKVYSERKNFADKTWAKSDMINFSWNINDTANLYSLVLWVSHKDELDYQNLYVRCTSINPDETNSIQLLSLELLSPAGKPNGKCTFGNCKAEIPLQEKVKFLQAGKYQLNLEQFSRDSIYNGIEAMELEIIKEES